MLWLGVAATAAAAVLAPVWTYALSLALFGLPHVACELRYLDQRFGARLGGVLPPLLATLLMIAGLRAAALAGLGDAASRAAIEFGLGALLVATVLPRLWASNRGLGALGAAVLGLSLWSATTAPLLAIVWFALLHNVTPVGLLAERLRGRPRAIALGCSAVVFVLLPLWIASGLPAAWLDAAGLPSTTGAPPRTGELALHLGAFVPGPWLEAPWALDLFSAAAFLQCAHYAAVIHVLPRLGAGSGATGRFAWPPPRTFAVLVLLATGALLAAYVAAFADARAVYGVNASVHAWVEVPVLLLAGARAVASAPPCRRRGAAVTEG
jgi:hypothetical protein